MEKIGHGRKGNSISSGEVSVSEKKGEGSADCGSPARRRKGGIFYTWVERGEIEVDLKEAYSREKGKIRLVVKRKYTAGRKELTRSCSTKQRFTERREL